MTGYGGNPRARLSPALLRALALLMLELTEDTRLPETGWRTDVETRLDPYPLPSTGGHDEAELILADARARARDLIEESMQRARALIAEGRAGGAGREPAGEALRDVRRAVTDLASEVRALQQRFDRLEALLNPVLGAGADFRPPERPGARVAPRTVAPAQPGAPTAASSATEAPSVWNAPPPEPRPVPAPGLGAGLPTTPAAPPLWVASAEAPDGDGSAAPPLDVGSASVQSALTAAGPASVAGTSGPEHRSEAAQSVAPPRPAAPAGVTFAPEDGLVSVRISPVAGFQGLMRMQEALLHVPGVREAGVDAYARGEAALRLQLAAAVNVYTMAAGLADRLGQVVRVDAVSEPDRLVRLVLA